MKTGQKLGILVVMVTVSTSAPLWSQNRVIVIEEESLTVELEKPEAFYILSPSNLDYQSLAAEASFLQELYETVEEEPF